MEVTLGVIADFANVTREGKANAIGIFHNIDPPEIPWHHPQMVLVLRFEADPQESGTTKDVRVVLDGPDGEEILSLENQMVVPQAADPGYPVGMDAQISLNGVTFEAHGDYVFAIMINGEVRHRVPLRVTPPPSSEGPAANGN